MTVLIGDGWNRGRPKFALASVSGKLAEVIEQGAANFALEDFRHAGNGTSGLIEGDTFDTGHWEEDGGKANPFGIELIDFTDEMIERVEVDATDGDAAGIEVEQDAPNFLFWGVQADDDDGVGVHGGW
jgi:hypothetical protein